AAGLGEVAVDVDLHERAVGAVLLFLLAYPVGQREAGNARFAGDVRGFAAADADGVPTSAVRVERVIERPGQLGGVPEQHQAPTARQVALQGLHDERGQAGRFISQVERVVPAVALHVLALIRAAAADDATAWRAHAGGRVERYVEAELRAGG